eukprot:9109300-Lingulodinium_polyedra.AAC.1
MAQRRFNDELTMSQQWVSNEPDMSQQRVNHESTMRQRYARDQSPMSQKRVNDRFRDAPKKSQ